MGAEERTYLAAGRPQTSHTAQHVSFYTWIPITDGGQKVNAPPFLQDGVADCFIGFWKVSPVSIVHFSRRPVHCPFFRNVTIHFFAKCQCSHRIFKDINAHFVAISALMFPAECFKRLMLVVESYMFQFQGPFYGVSAQGGIHP